MWKDPIVEEVRQAGEKIAKKANYNLHEFIINMKKNENKRGTKTISRIIREKYCTMKDDY